MTYVSPGRQGEQKEYTVGFDKGTTWHTPANVGTGICLFVEAINFPITGGQRIPDPGIGRAFGAYNPPIGKIECKGDLSFSAATYGQIDHLFAACFGDDAMATGANSTATHTITVANSLWGNFYTLAYNFRGNDTVEFPSIKWTGFELTANPGEVAKVKFNGIADYALTTMTKTYDGLASGGTFTVASGEGSPFVPSTLIGLYFVVDAVTGATATGTSYLITANGATNVACGAAADVVSGHIGPYNTGGAGGTFFDTAFEAFGDRLHTDDLVVRIGTAASAVLATDGTADYNVGAVKITFERPMEGDYRTATTGANALSKHSVWEPRDTGIIKMSAEITFPNYDAQVADLLKYWVSATPQSRRVEFVWTSTTMAGGAIPFSLKIYMPGAFISGNPATMPLSGGMPVTLKFEATYFTDTADYLPSMSIVNTNAADLITAPSTW